MTNVEILFYVAGIPIMLYGLSCLLGLLLTCRKPKRPKWIYAWFTKEVPVKFDFKGYTTRQEFVEDCLNKDVPLATILEKAAHGIPKKGAKPKEGWQTLEIPNAKDGEALFPDEDGANWRAAVEAVKNGDAVVDISKPPPTGSVVVEPGEESSKKSRKVKTRDGELTITPPEIEVPYIDFPLLTIGKLPETKTVSGTWITFDEVLQAWRVPPIPDDLGEIEWEDLGESRDPQEWYFDYSLQAPVQIPRAPARYRTYRTRLPCVIRKPSPTQMEKCALNPSPKYTDPNLPKEPGVSWMKVSENRIHDPLRHLITFTQVWRAIADLEGKKT